MTGTLKKYEGDRLMPLVKSLLFILVFIGLLVISGRMRFFLPAKYTWLGYGVLGSLAGMLTVWIFMKAEKKPFASIGMVWERKTLFRFVFGFLVGSIIFAVMFFALIYFSGLRVQYNPNAFNSEAFLIYLSILPLALMEEIGFRSYPQIKLERSYGVWTSQVVVAIAFGAYHVLNGWSWPVAFMGPFVWAFVYGLSALWSRGIAVATGIHFAVNIGQNVAGMKGKTAAIWLLDVPENAPAGFMDKVDNIGWILQGCVFIGALIATAIYVRGLKKIANP